MELRYFGEGRNFTTASASGRVDVEEISVRKCSVIQRVCLDVSVKSMSYVVSGCSKSVVYYEKIMADLFGII